ncbi:N-acetylmuramoyl-L-alanine amidase-like domain-containing protein, partial [Anaeromyxobacter oryzisoli]|uniref:N-acetylmuramoyl-L-alanine amidase-like domain-containing protein n=1 Tax=Anaeromyxobacter oryzisoli TaxID=2925408 RepID=UPI001F5A0FD3
AAPAGGARAAAATRPLLGAPYVVSPLGEGRGPDPDPRFRLDAFDCMTFVETAVALGSARTLAEARRALDDVRYAGPPSLGGRNHEVLSQWIPRVLARGWARDVAREVAGSRARRVEEVYTPARWDAVRRAGRAIPGLPRARLPAGAFEAWVVSPEDAVANAGGIPEGTIAFVVRAHAEERATRVTHAGLVVVGRDGGRRVRHATSTRGVSRVIEEPLARFLAREAKAHPRWPVEGVALLAIEDGRARLQALAEQGGRGSPARPAARPEVPSPTPAPPPRL